MSKQPQYIVVWDPSGKYTEGSIVNETVVTTIRARGGVSLPVEPDMFRIAGTAGYFRRGWGAGWPVDFPVPRAFAPMTLFLDQKHDTVAWCARLVPDERLAERARTEHLNIEGHIAIASIPPRGNAYSTSITSKTTPKRIRDLGVTDEDGGWIVEGRGSVLVQMEGNHSFSLYGSAPGVRVVWAAITSFRT